MLYGKTIELHHKIVTEAIDHDAGKAVTVAINQSITGVVEHPIAKCQGLLKAFGHK